MSGKGLRTARRVGRLVGAGTTPAEAAGSEYLYPDELVALRIEHWQEYDRGLVEGREGRVAA